MLDIQIIRSEGDGCESAVIPAEGAVYRWIGPRVDSFTHLKDDLQ